MDLDIIHPPLSRLADRGEDDNSSDGGDGIEYNISPHGAKRWRFNSPRCESNLHHTSTLPLPYHEDWGSSAANACVTSSDDSGNDGFLSKRQKLLDSLDSWTSRAATMRSLRTLSH